MGVHAEKWHGGGVRERFLLCSCVGRKGGVVPSFYLRGFWVGVRSFLEEEEGGGEEEERKLGWFLGCFFRVVGDVELVGGGCLGVRVVQCDVGKFLVGVSKASECVGVFGILEWVVEGVLSWKCKGHAGVVASVVMH